jgi:hypothetical protein
LINKDEGCPRKMEQPSVFLDVILEYELLMKVDVLRKHV